MIARQGYVVLDAYFDPYDGALYHDLASVTKSVMTTLIGIAVDQGRLRLEDQVLSFFPERAIANRDERKELQVETDVRAAIGNLVDFDRDDVRAFHEHVRVERDLEERVLVCAADGRGGGRRGTYRPGRHIVANLHAVDVDNRAVIAQEA